MKVALTELRFDAFKELVAVKIETADPADVHNDYRKFPNADSLGQRDVGVLIVYDDSIQGDKLPKQNVAKKVLDTYSNLISYPSGSSGGRSTSRRTVLPISDTMGRLLGD